MTCSLFKKTSLAVTFAIGVSSVQADIVSDSFFLNTYNEAGCSGNWTGMTCEGRNNVTPKWVREFEAKREARNKRQTEHTERILVGIDSLLSSHSEFRSQMGGFPAHQAFKQEQLKNVVCLRSHIAALLMFEHDPKVLDIIRREEAGSAHDFRGDDDRYLFNLAYRHLLDMYSQARTILGDTKTFSDVNLFDAERNSALEHLILSQVEPAFAQLAYLNNEIPLIGSTPHERVLYSAIRVGFIRQDIPGLDYPFTDRICGRDVALLNPIDKKLLNDFLLSNMAEKKFSKLLPSALYEAFPEGSYERSDEAAAIRLASAERRNREEKRAKARAERERLNSLIDDIIKATPGCMSSKEKCPSRREALALAKKMMVEDNN